MLQRPSQTNGDNLNNVKRETSRIFTNKNTEYLNRRKNSLYQLLRVHDVSDVRHTETHIVEPLIPEHSYLEYLNLIVSKSKLVLKR
jgi:hypothetical protein